RRASHVAVDSDGKEPMKITCQACQAKYTIADEKIQGKIAKIRCRKCGATVLVDASAGGGKAEAPMPPVGTDAWMVSVADGDQRTMPSQEVAQAYASKTVTDETYVWKDGMADWQPLAEVAELIAVARAAGDAAAPVRTAPAAEVAVAAAPAP